MSKIAIVTDSTAYLPQSIIDTYNITVLPQVLIWGEETLQDGVDILPAEFYKRLETSKVMPTTSQVSIMTMKNAFEKLLNQGYEVLGIFISSKLSGTIQSATQAKEMLKTGQDKVAIVDSLSTSMAMGFHILYAARAAESGASLEDCRKLAVEAQKHTGVYLVVDTLEFLRRGGRIGGATAFLGSALNLKPILALRDGKIEGVEKVRTKRKALDRMVEIIAEEASGKTPVRVATLHANDEMEGRSALDAITSKLNPAEKYITDLSPVVGTHAGPGTVGIAYISGM